ASLASAYADFAASGALTAQADAQTMLSSSHTSDSFPLTVASYATRIVQVAATCSDTTLSVSVSAGGSALAPKLVVAGATYELTAGLSGYSATVPWKSPCSTGAARLVVPNVGAGDASVTAQVAA